MNLAEHLPHLTSFALCLLFMLTLPRLMQRLGLPGPIGFILTGIVLGPQVLGVLKPDWPVLVWFADMGKLLLMFLVGFDIELSEFARARNKSALFGADDGRNEHASLPATILVSDFLCVGLGNGRGDRPKEVGDSARGFDVHKSDRDW